jgi:probable O-glycosylation ligase (exosortase A-associated)
MVAVLPVCLRAPWVGVLAWSWVGYMNPHRLIWGFARGIPWAQLVAIAVLAGVWFTRDRKPIPWLRESWMLAALWVMFTLTTITALYPGPAFSQWQKVSKVLLFTFITMMFFQDIRRLRVMFLVVAGSIGFYGFKGGIWAILTGGKERVLGPPSTYFAGNTTVGAAMLMVLPFLYYLQKDEPRPWARNLMKAGFWLNVVAVIATYSRGAMVALPIVLGVLFLKGGRRLVTGLVTTAATALIFLVLGRDLIPEKWWARMATIETYEQDASARSRLVRLEGRLRGGPRPAARGRRILGARGRTATRGAREPQSKS